MKFMTDRGITQFIEFCDKTRQSCTNFRDFFEQAICQISSERELLLQAFLFFNSDKFFPSCIDVVLFEQSPDGLGNTHFGKCDFIYTTEKDTLFLIETKFINTRIGGKTARNTRNSQRNKVFEQVISLKQKLSQFWEIPEELLDCGVFTTDPRLLPRGLELNVATKSISIEQLENWHLAKKHELKTKVNN
ncbi:hypothetical protein [Lyngbya aestuarii]|uniref:hypothetical protein n=1 Tax=Lyngbya aestuarii TaxID=118322 RepID=UPI00403DC2F1